MSDERQNLEAPAASSNSGADAKAEPAPIQAAPASNDSLDAVEDIDFLLEEIENKIAPLALA